MKTKFLLICLLSIPFTMSCGYKETYLDEVNKLLTDNESSIHTCYDAVNLVGDKLYKHALKDNQEYAYDSLQKKFVVMEDEVIVEKSRGYEPSENTLDYFKFVTTYNPNSKYSQYLLESASSQDALLITTGFDAGTHKDIKNIAYANESNDGRNVLIRAYCDYLSILAPSQTITHYEDATNVIITDCKKYNEHGESAYMKASKGSVYISNDSTCALDMFEKVKGKEEQVSIDYEIDSRVYGLINCSDEEIKEGSTAYKLIEKRIDSDKVFREYTTKKHDEKFLRLESDIIFDSETTPLETINVDHALCIDLNGFKLSFSNFEKGSSSVNEAMRIQSSVENDEVVDKSVYIIDSQGVLDEHSGISLNNCSIVVAGAETVTSRGKVPSSNFVLNSGKITQTITKEENTGAAVTILGKTKESHKTKDANFIMYGGKISCDNQTNNENSYGCIVAVGDGSNVNIEFGVLTSTDFCIYGQESLSEWKLNDAHVVIYGGTLTSKRNTCLFFPSTTYVDIEGGKINGQSCITASSGTLKISNSTTLNATGSGTQHNDKNYDGSTIYVPKHKFDEGELKVDVSNSKLTSRHEYISNVKYSESVTKNKTIFDFQSGTYTYKMDDGLLFANPELVSVTNKLGKWNKSI